jgi:hypothetical protein
MISAYVELLLTGLAAMLEPATLLASALAVTTGDHRLRTGSWFYLGGLGATLAVGVIAAFVVGTAAASSESTPKTWVAVITLTTGGAVLVAAVRLLMRRDNSEQVAKIDQRMKKVAAGSPAVLIAAGAVLANPGLFMLVAAKDISQLDPSTVHYVVLWALFALVALLPLGVAILTLLVAPGFAEPRLAALHGWLTRHAGVVAGIVMLGLAGALLRDGIVALLR